MEKTIQLLNEAHDLLASNPDVIDIFRIEDDKRTLKEFEMLEAFHSISWVQVVEAFEKTLNYLIEFLDEIDLSNLLSDSINKLIIALKEKMPLIKERIDDIDLNIKLLILKTNVLFLMFSVTSTISKKVDSLISNDLSLKSRRESGVYYRGHEDEKYKLIPSIMRNYDISKYGQKMDINVLTQLYDLPNLTDKYESVFHKRNVDDEFCAFMQHSAAFSPFLDLTRNHLVALTFATSNHGNINDYFGKNSAVYEFCFNKKHIQNSVSLSSTLIIFIKNRLTFFSQYGTTYLFYCSPSLFNPKVCLIDNMSNDRMKYQDGAFLFFESCIVVNGHILMPFKIGKIVKYIIPPFNKANPYLAKNAIYQTIVDNYRLYDYDHLMNPYLYFSEINK